MSIEPVTHVNNAAAADPSSDADSSKVQEAFSQGLVLFMGTLLQSAESEIVASINDNTSTPDAPF